MNWFTDILNMFFTFLDRIVYGLITTLYQLFLYLANLDLFSMSKIGESGVDASNNVIINFSSRVYALLGIFMLFKISFSILQYMVNPDDFSDKNKGFGKLVTNVLVSLVLIVTVPYIFQKAFEIQGIILEENLLGKLILGNSVSDDMKAADNVSMAEDLQFLVYGSFFSVNTDVVKSCENGPVLGTKAMAKEKSCLEDLSNLLPDGANKLGDFFPEEADKAGRRFDAFGEIVNTKKEDEYVFNYMPVISTITGGFIVVMLLSFCLDVAVRIIKLGFLEIISPIPIISYMDPKQSSRDGMLGKWAKECGSTFLSLFIRIALIYFAFFIVDLVTNELLTEAGDQLYLNDDVPVGLMAIFVRVMVIIGVFLFAKEVPKLLENIMGIKDSGSLHFDRIKALGIGAAAGVGAGIGGFAANAIAGVDWNNVKDNADNLKNDVSKIRSSQHMSFGNKAKAIGGLIGGAGIAGGKAMIKGTPRISRTAIAGAGSAAIRGAYYGGKNKKVLSGMTEGRKGATEARNERDIRQATDYKRRDQIADAVAKFANIKNKAGGVGAMDQKVKDWTRLMNNAEGQEHAMRDQQSSWVGTETSHSFRDFQKAVFAPKLDKDGNVLMDADKNIIYDETKTKEYSEYLKSLQPGEKPIEQQEYEKFKSMQDDINMFDQTREYYRKQIKDYQDVIDMKGKNGK